MEFVLDITSSDGFHLLHIKTDDLNDLFSKLNSFERSGAYKDHMEYERDMAMQTEQNAREIERDYERDILSGLSQ